MRRATEADLPDLVSMGRAFHEAVQPAWPLSEAGLAGTLRALMQGGYVARTDGGFIAGVLQGNPIAEGWLVAKEFLWWAEDGQGMALRRGFREWARENGAQEVQWSCPAGNERVRRLYARSAVETEAIYSEYLTCA